MATKRTGNSGRSRIIANRGLVARARDQGTVTRKPREPAGRPGPRDCGISPRFPGRPSHNLISPWSVAQLMDIVRRIAPWNGRRTNGLTWGKSTACAPPREEDPKRVVGSNRDCCSSCAERNDPTRLLCLGCEAAPVLDNREPSRVGAPTNRNGGLGRGSRRRR